MRRARTIIPPARHPHPGAIIERELFARGWDWNVLATVSGISHDELVEIASGEKMISAGIAASLAEAFGTSRELWTTLETGYRMFLERFEK